MEVGGSNPFPRDHMKIKPFQIRWNEKLGREDCPYATRYVLNLWLFSIRIHIWRRSDDKRYMHDHPWGFLTLVVRGYYTDVSLRGRDVMRVGSVRHRRSGHRHYVEVPRCGCITILFTGPAERKWGFYLPSRNRLLRPLRYFSRYGHPPCSEQ